MDFQEKGLSDEAVSAACSEGHALTKDYMLQQTMLRVKDPARSLDFYTRILGMTLLQKIDFPSMRFTFYYLGYEDKVDIPADVKERTAWTFSRRATLELTHNWGSESDADLSYHNGNNELRGFGENLFVQRSDRFVCFSMLDLLWVSLLSCFLAGHIGIAVPDVYAACKLFEEQGVKFVKKPDTE
ncbi:unnamed protein product [Oreochromis niloticus]|nr:unnamed protein product [Mustela putorius furo]